MVSDCIVDDLKMYMYVLNLRVRDEKNKKKNYKELQTIQVKYLNFYQ